MLHMCEAGMFHNNGQHQEGNLCVLTFDLG